MPTNPLRTMSDYQSFYENNLLPHLEEIDEERIKVLKNRLGIASLSALVILIHSILIASDILPSVTLFITLFAVPTGGYFGFKKYFDKFADIEESFRNIVLKEVLKEQLHGDCEETGFIPYNTFKESQMLRETPQHYTGAYLTEGRVGKYNVEASLLQVGNLEEGGKWEQIFEGLFVAAEGGGSFEGFMTITPDDLQKRLGLLGKKIQANSRHLGEYISTPYRRFSKTFAIYTDNPIEAQKLIEDEFVALIMSYVDNYNDELYIICRDEKLFLAFDLYQKSANFNHWLTVKNPKKYEKLYNQLSMAFEILEAVHRRK